MVATSGVTTSAFLGLWQSTMLEKSLPRVGTRSQSLFCDQVRPAHGGCLASVHLEAFTP